MQEVWKRMKKKYKIRQDMDVIISIIASKSPHTPLSMAAAKQYLHLTRGDDHEYRQ